MKTLRGRAAHGGNHPDTYFWPENSHLLGWGVFYFQLSCCFRSYQNSIAQAAPLQEHGWLTLSLTTMALAGTSQDGGSGRLCSIQSPGTGGHGHTVCLCCLWAKRHFKMQRCQVGTCCTFQHPSQGLRESKRKSCVSSKCYFIPAGFSSRFALGYPLRLGTCCMDVVNRKWKFLWGLCKSPDTDSGMWLAAFTCHTGLCTGSFWLEEIWINVKVLFCSWVYSFWQLHWSAAIELPTLCQKLNRCSQHRGLQRHFHSFNIFFSLNPFS